MTLEEVESRLGPWSTVDSYGGGYTYTFENHVPPIAVDIDRSSGRVTNISEWTWIDPLDPRLDWPFEDSSDSDDNVLMESR